MISASPIVKTLHPIIGVLAQESTGRISNDGEGQYVVQAYTEMMQNAGARVVPFLINKTDEEVDKLFNSINGLVLPGGHVRLQDSNYGKIGKRLYELAVEANNKGSVFPIWAECLGFELLALCASGRGVTHGQFDEALFEYTDAKNYSVPVQLVKDYTKSRFLGTASPDMIGYLNNSLKAFNNHDKALTPKTFNKFPGIKNDYRIITVNRDRVNTEYISTMEGKKWPFFLLDWHPTKPMFPWMETYAQYDHSQQAIAITQFMASSFVNIARMSDHTFPNPQEELLSLIENYTPTLTKDRGNVYFFPMPTKTPQMEEE
ncbi:predicted protein [Nematostella vectensis]|uniref:folate gamma-glutamyl hydrolase n=1 Tax=Nematostella vectensis TaxID=45351 RepID=A7RKP9_NEMVE|nr:predicted protein [Nematostella vectensis]|eukprot:XP_001640008.1 predicted protein [Nematostella vectensis]